MADDGGEGFNIHAVFQSRGGKGMPQVMETYLLALGVFQNDMQAAADGGRVQGRIRLDRGGEHPAGMNGLLVFLQHGQQGSGEQKRPVGRLGFRLRDEQTVLRAVDLLVDTQLPGVEVQIIPLQRQQFPAAHAGGEFQQEQLVVAFLFRLDEEPLHLLAGEYLHFPCLFRWQFTADGGVDANQSVLHRLFQRGTADGMTATHHLVGQTGSVVFPPAYPAIGFQLRVELLEVVLRQLVQRDIAQLRDDVVVDFRLISGLGTMI